jgi:transcriptional regulator with XRE-family HTH domain
MHKRVINGICASVVFPTRLKKARIHNGYTQKQIAKDLHISPSTYACYEIGRSEPNLQNLNEIARFFGVSIDWLVGMTVECHIKLTKEEREHEKTIYENKVQSELKQRLCA